MQLSFELQVLPYWGNPHERKIIRKYWSPVSVLVLMHTLAVVAVRHAHCVYRSVLSLAVVFLPFQKLLFKENSPFHILITSYQLVSCHHFHPPSFRLQSSFHSPLYPSSIPSFIPSFPVTVIVFLSLPAPHPFTHVSYLSS